MDRPEIEKPDLDEKGSGEQRSSRRLYMHLLVMTGCGDPGPLGEVLDRHGVEGALYEGLHDPWGVGLLTMSEDPAWFVTGWRALRREPSFASLTVRPEYTMLGRTYGLGHEPDLEDSLLHRPRRAVLDPEWPWAVWYPLRRRGTFEQLEPARRREILAEHGKIGMRFGRSGLARDIRLACHGLDQADNDFVIGLTGRELHPLSAVVQHMRGTTQTAQHLERLGPFFVGRAVWQSSRVPG